MYLGGWALAGTLSVLGALGAAELYRLAARRDIHPLGPAGWVGAALIPLGTFAALPAGGGVEGRWMLLAGASWLIAIMLGAMVTRSPDRRPLGAVSVTVFGALYAGGLPSLLMWLRHGAAAPSALAGTWLVFLPLALTWACDTLAMLGGALIGGAKLAPILSPNKTWAGAVWGAVGATAAGPVYGAWFLSRVGVPIPVWELALVGLGVGVFGQLGDLAESLFKREAGVKDSGAFFPGHGGVLDRLDSLYWSIPVSVLLLKGLGHL